MQGDPSKNPDASDTFKKPRTLTCCVCGRDFGLTSLKIHYPQCADKFIVDQKKKPKGDRKEPPQFTEQQLEMVNNKTDWTLEEIEAFNKGANNNYRDNAMVQCPNCGRKFIEQAYLKHKKNCTLINGKKQAPQSQSKSSSLPANQFRSTSTQFKKPRTLQCCVCGREFGLTSLKIHYPQCLDKFINDEKKKPKTERKQAPQFTEEQLEMINNKEDWTMEEVQAFNNRANSNYRENAMVQCSNCGRKFLQQSYLKHKKNCQLINGNNKSGTSLAKQKQKGSQSTDANFRPTSPEFKKPRTLTCCVCGRDFGLTSLKIHYPQCVEKFIADEKKKPKAERKEPPQFSEEQLEMINNKTDWSLEDIQAFNKGANVNYRDNAMVQCPNCGRKFLQQSYLKHKKNCALINGKKQGADSIPKLPAQTNPAQIKKPKVLMCHVCGRQFGLSSLSIHIPQCEEKFLNAQKKKPKQQRRALPAFPPEMAEEYNLEQAPSWDISKIEDYNKIANDVYRAQSLCPCPICGRKFFQESLPKHLKFCEKNKQKEASTQKREPKSQSLTKDHTLAKKTSNKSQEALPKQIIEEQHEDHSNQSTPHKAMENESFLKKELYKKMEASCSKNQKQAGMPEIEGIKQADEELEDTIKVKKPQLIEGDEDKSQANQFLQAPNKEKKQAEPQQQPKQQASEVSLDESIESSQLQEQIVSPSAKARSSKGFAAPRKKQEALHANMKECKICNRKFADDKLEKHEKLCFDNRQRQRKSQKRLAEPTASLTNSVMTQSVAVQEEKKQEIKERDVLSPEDKIRLKKGFAAPRQKQSQSQAKMSQCRGCKRKFAQDRIEKHESICKAAQEQLKQPFVAGSYKKIEESMEGQKLSIKRAPCPKCNRKFAEDRLAKHIQICKANPPVSTDLSSSSSATKTAQKSTIPAREPKLDQSAFESVSLEMCQKCGRKFNTERIAKHQEICKGTAIQAEANTTANAFKKQKQTKEAPKKQYNLDKIEVQNAGDNDDRVECPKCLRKFAADRLQKHANACKAVPPLSNIDTKAKPTPKLELGPLKQKPPLKPLIQTPKAQQKLVKTIGQDQYVQNQLEPCLKCSRKFVPERLQKHMQICKGNTKIEKPPHSKPSAQIKKPLNEQQLRKTKNQFFGMMKDLKTKKIKDQQIEKELDKQLYQIQATNKISRKQNVNRQNSEKKKPKDIHNVNKSINLPKIG